MNDLALYDEIVRDLARITTAAEAKDERDKAAALEVFARHSRDKELVARAVRYKRLAARRLGELLIELAETGERAARGRPKMSQPATFSLDTLNLTRSDSSRCQELARLPMEEFESGVEAAVSESVRACVATREERQAEKHSRRAFRETELGARQQALPARKFGVVVADPEWRFEPWSRATGMDRAPDNHYPTSCLEVIAARDVASIAADDCVLFLWATAPMLPHALVVMAAWGFDYKSHYVWGKDKIGTGYWAREKHELLLVGARGGIPCPAMGTQWASLIEAPRGEHSAKPECFLEMIESYFPSLPKIELNRRGASRPGWDAWGNEAS